MEAAKNFYYYYTTTNESKFHRDLYCLFILGAVRPDVFVISEEYRYDSALHHILFRFRQCSTLQNTYLRLVKDYTLRRWNR